MNHLKVSVIIPVFNADLTISKCIDSFIKQTLSGWELILIDDGSTDKSGDICDWYAQRNEVLPDSKYKIYVVHKQNEGVSVARQVGIEMAKGEYVIHADADDWVDPLMLEELYHKAKIDDADMVICDYVKEIDGKTIYQSQAPTSSSHNDVLNDMFGKIHGSCCNKLVRRQCILRYNVKFPKGINYCEDVCFNVQLLLHNIKVTYLSKSYYHYVYSSSSITNYYTRKTFDSHKKFVDYIASILPSNSYPVIESKLLIKKLAFRNAVLTNQELSKLYPDVLDAHERILFLKWMYNLAFTNHFILAKILRCIYKIYILNKRL